MSFESRIIAPNIITRPIGAEAAAWGAWALRFELVDNIQRMRGAEPGSLPDIRLGVSGLPLQRKSYAVRAPIGAAFALDEARLLVLEDAINNVPSEETIARYQRLTGREITVNSLKNPRKKVLFDSDSLTISEAACKAIVLKEVEPDVSVELLRPLTDAHLAVLAARGAGLGYEDMDFLDAPVGTLTGHANRARRALQTPLHAGDANFMARGFAARALIIGEPYDPARMQQPAPQAQ